MFAIVFQTIPKVIDDGLLIVIAILIILLALGGFFVFEHLENKKAQKEMTKNAQLRRQNRQSDMNDDLHVLYRPRASEMGKPQSRTYQSSSSNSRRSDSDPIGDTIFYSSIFNSHDPHSSSHDSGSYSSDSGGSDSGGGDCGGGGE